jgi:predicted PurR-regulated permease PerM
MSKNTRNDSEKNENISGFWEFLEEGPRTSTIFFIISTILLLWILKSILAPFIIACILAGVTWPLRNRLLKLTGNRANLTSGIMIIGLIFLVAVPVGIILTLATAQARDLLVDFNPNTVWAWVQSQQEHLDNSPIAHQLGFKPEMLGPKAQEALSEFTSWGMKSVFAIGSSLLNVLVLSGIALMSLFYLYLTGDRMVERVQRLIPLPSDQVGELFSIFRKTSRAIFKGNFVIGGIQGILTGSLFWVAGLPSPTFFGVTAALCSLIPAVGTGLIWGPAGILLLVSGEVGRALLVLGVGVGLISMVDNFLRPVLVGRDAGMHDLMVFLTTVGGLSFFGPVGILFGPLVGAGVTAMLRVQELSQESKAGVPADSGDDAAPVFHA